MLSELFGTFSSILYYLSALSSWSFKLSLTLYINWLPWFCPLPIISSSPSSPNPELSYSSFFFILSAWLYNFSEIFSIFYTNFCGSYPESCYSLPFLEIYRQISFSLLFSLIRSSMKAIYFFILRFFSSSYKLIIFCNCLTSCISWLLSLIWHRSVLYPTLLWLSNSKEFLYLFYVSDISL